MRVILQVVSGSSEGRQIPLQVGEIARFGRSDAADVCFPEDAEMSEVHFELECQSDRCMVRDLNSAGGTFLNEQPVSEAIVCHGDAIQAGQTILSTAIDGNLTVGELDAEATASDGEEASAVQPKTAAELCSLLELDEESQELLLPEHTPVTFLKTLVSHERFADAIRVLSFCLSKRQAVWWAYHCVQEFLGEAFSPDEEAAMNAALAWVKEPTEQNRRAAMTAAESIEVQAAPSWVALSAFWSDGSLAPADLPDVAPDDGLTSQGVSAALLMTATRGDVTKSREKYQHILKTGHDVLDGMLPLPT